MNTTNISGIFEVSPITGDSLESADYLHCDLCDHSPIFDPPGPMSPFYLDLDEGLYVCNGCIEQYLTASKP